MSTSYRPRVEHHIATELAGDVAGAAMDAVLDKHIPIEGAGHTCTCGRSFMTREGHAAHDKIIVQAAEKAFEEAYDAHLTELGY